MVDSANVETTTMEMTAENPPRKTKVARNELPFSKGKSKV